MNREAIISMDPNMLLSLVNMKLRDSFSSLEALCDDIDVSESELCDKLSSIGCTYLKEINQFR